MEIVSIDPSFRNMALIHATVDCAKPTELLIESYHLEQTAKSTEGSRREDDWKCARDLASVVMPLTEDADVIFIEQPVGSQSARSAWTLGITLGILACMKPHVITLTAGQVKQTFTGNRQATKSEMIHKACLQFPEVRFPMYKQRGRLQINAGKAEHIADSLAVMYTGVRTKEFKDICQRQL